MRGNRMKRRGAINKFYCPKSKQTGQAKATYSWNHLSIPLQSPPPFTRRKENNYYDSVVCQPNRNNVRLLEARDEMRWPRILVATEISFFWQILSHPWPFFIHFIPSPSLRRATTTGRRCVWSWPWRVNDCANPATVEPVWPSSK